MNLSAIAAVIRFEWSRMLTTPRILGWVGLTCFPPTIVFLLVLQGDGPQDWKTTVIFVLVPLVLCVLSLLLWVSPLIHSELEGKSWVYLAVRPGGRSAVLLGKYLAGVFRTVVSGWVSMTLCIVICRPDNALRLWSVFFLLVTLSAAAYGAIFALIAAVFHRRAMVMAGAYTLVFEVAVSLVPAVINQLTVNYRLRSLLLTLLNRRATQLSELFSDAPATVHLLTIFGTIVAVLVVALLIINRREYIESEAEA